MNGAYAWGSARARITIGSGRCGNICVKAWGLLILDEWLLYPLKETEARDLLEIAEARYRKASTIFCSQFDVPGWRDKIGDPILADAICDRIVHDSYSIVIECKESMRKRKGVQEADA